MPKRKRDEVQRVDASTLHTQGYVILPGFVDIPQAVTNCIYRQSTRTKPIFGPDRKRRQARMYSRSRYMKRFTSQLNSELDQLLSSLSDNYVRDDWQILISKEGCKRQPSHTDYEPDGGVLEVPDREVPLAAVLALEDRTNLVVWPNFINYDFDGFDQDKGELAEFNAGDLLIFRGDLVHAGAEYPDRENVRLHCFVDHKDVDRRNNRTHLVK